MTTPNNVKTNGALAHHTNAASTSQLDDKSSVIVAPSKSSLTDLPPEIAHITLNCSLSRLLTRAAQTLYTDISTGAFVNKEDKSDNGKRTGWLEFAHENREKFIKLLVLVQWSRNVDHVSKLIDLTVWSNTRVEVHNELSWYTDQLEAGLDPLQLPDADLNEALEGLGIASQPPDQSGYFPPPSLTARQLLNSLEDLDTILHIRLNVHEELPIPFRGYTISSGRVTFHVFDEFEVDLTVADEDPTTQFWFIDFRYLSGQRKEAVSGPFRHGLEKATNEALAAAGLTGCYEFLHDYILTHKLNLLEKRARELAATTWQRSVRVETHRRVLIVQYWAERPGKKSWIQFGIKSGKVDQTPSAAASSLDVQWAREGTFVKDCGLTFAMDIENVLEDAIKKHIDYLIATIKDPTVRAVTRIEPVSGRISFSVGSTLSNYEASLNDSSRLMHDLSRLEAPRKPRKQTELQRSLSKLQENLRTRGIPNTVERAVVAGYKILLDLDSLFPQAKWNSRVAAAARIEVMPALSLDCEVAGSATSSFVACLSFRSLPASVKHAFRSWRAHDVRLLDSRRLACRFETSPDSIIDELKTYLQQLQALIQYIMVLGARTFPRWITTISTVSWIYGKDDAHDLVAAVTHHSDRAPTVELLPRNNPSQVVLKTLHMALRTGVRDAAACMSIVASTLSFTLPVLRGFKSALAANRHLASLHCHSTYHFVVCFSAGGEKTEIRFVGSSETPAWIVGSRLVLGNAVEAAVAALRPSEADVHGVTATTTVNGTASGDGNKTIAASASAPVMAAPIPTSLKKEPAQKEPAQKGPAQKGPAQKGPAASAAKKGGLGQTNGVAKANGPGSGRVVIDLD
ncbi:hypothetical protein MRB53_040478 [Persea americana]|nr:hypothetical protein MRB53_040478 [Persea americana]